MEKIDIARKYSRCRLCVGKEKSKANRTRIQIYFMLTIDSLIFMKNIFKLLIHTIGMG